MDEKRINTRKHPRVLIRALVDYESQDTYLYDYSENLSQGGIFIHTDKPLDVGDRIELRFSLPDVEKVFEILGEVKWINAEKKQRALPGMGIEFMNLNEEDKSLLAKYIERAVKR